MENEIESIPDHTPEDDCRDDINVEALENTLTAKLRSDSSLSAKSCIFRVPQVLRRHKPEAYEPYVLSIGPFHRGGKQFEPVENAKKWYVHNLLSLLKINMKTLIQGIGNIIEFEKGARGFYAEPLDLSKHELIEMMIFDGCFLIELFRRFLYKEYKPFRKDGNDPILNMEPILAAPEEENDNDTILNMICMHQYLRHDLMLLENQLPWFVLQYLHSLAVVKLPYLPDLKILVLKFLNSVQSLNYTFKSYCRHILLRNESNDGGGDGGEILHILDMLRTAMVFQFIGFDSIPCSEVKLPPATTLSQAGVKLRTGSNDGGIMNIDFEDGVFAIPRLVIAELTEPLLRNLIALEQCYHGRSPKITSYAILMNDLIVSSKDIDFLCEKEIMKNGFSSENGAQLFNGLCDDTLINSYFYGELCAEVNKYYNVSWHRWLEKLKSDYFSNPWTITSLVAAFILLVLTLLQTAYTIQQYHHPSP